MPPQLLALAYKMLGHTAYLLAGIGSIAAIDFRDQITLGSIIVTCVLVAIAGLHVWRTF